MSEDENDGGRTEEEGLWKRMEFAISFFFLDFWGFVERRIPVHKGCRDKKRRKQLLGAQRT